MAEAVKARKIKHGKGICLSCKYKNDKNITIIQNKLAKACGVVTINKPKGKNKKLKLKRWQIFLGRIKVFLIDLQIV